MRDTRTRGFTIVELLIVIVVIAVLAAISIVAYNGIQQRAQDAAMGKTVDTFIKAVEMYKTDNDVYPRDDNNGFPLCIATSDSLKQTADFSEDVCMQQESDGSAMAVYSQELVDKLKPYVSEIPSHVVPTVRLEGVLMRSAMFISSGTDSASIYVPLSGSGDCIRGEKAESETGTAYCTINLPAN